MTRSQQDLRLEGERTALVPVAPAHALDLFPHVHGRDEVLRWLIWDGPSSVEELAAAYEEWRFPSPEGIGLHLAILERALEFRPVGTIGLRFQQAGLGDVGYWLASERWGRGLATEAVGLLAGQAFLQEDLTALSAWVDVGNEASRRVLEKNGFRLERTVRGKAAKRGGRADQWGFVLTRSDWRSQGA